ncbi:hypothetical protein RDI58_000469 [Solanum bulbocastanum]|uniref:DUF4283 domain-containing protein n=1 Tax=Solanum bulbocastanum TaxID=147425 RepID=A0AAN8UC36_SOLBU
MHLQQEILSHKISPDKDAATQSEIESEGITKDRNFKPKIDKKVSFKVMLIAPYSKTIDQQTTSRTNIEEDMIIDEPPETKSAIWIRLPELPTEFYDHSILARIGKKLGKLVKTDVCTSKALSGRYARICIEVPIGVPVKKSIRIGHHNQLAYEGYNILCLKCGVLGHTGNLCSHKPTTKETNKNQMEMDLMKDKGARDRVQSKARRSMANNFVLEKAESK